MDFRTQARSAFGLSQIVCGTRNCANGILAGPLYRWRLAGSAAVFQTASSASILLAVPLASGRHLPY